MPAASPEISRSGPFDLPVERHYGLYRKRATDNLSSDVAGSSSGRRSTPLTRILTSRRGFRFTRSPGCPPGECRWAALFRMRGGDRGSLVRKSNVNDFVLLASFFNEELYACKLIFRFPFFFYSRKINL